MTNEEILKKPAGHELNKLIAEFVFGMKLEKNHGFAGGYYWVGNGILFGEMPAQGTPDYSTNISAAWEVAGKVANEDSDLSVHITGEYPRGFWRCIFENAFVNYDVTAETAPLAICRAALMAVMK